MNFLQSILRGIGQVMFQNNSLSGFLFLVGLFYNSITFGLAALIGVIISTLTAQIMRYSKQEVQNGLYGFNGVLTGISVVCFFEVNTITILALLLGSVLSTLFMYQLKKIIPPFTAPFILASWLIIYSLLLVLNQPMIPISDHQDLYFNLFEATSNSFGQVMLQENIVTGLLFILAILVNNRLMLIYAIYAAVLSSLLGWLISQPLSTVNSGLMGYNAILCAIALVGNKWNDFKWISIAIILSTLVNIGLSNIGLITLTAPFVIVTWVLMKWKK